jgi:predicted permease
MRLLDALAARLVGGPDGDLIRHDLNELYARDRARGLSRSRAGWRYARLLAGSFVSVWQERRRHARLPDGASYRPLRGGSMLQDLQFALRLFRRHPAPVAIALGGLALAIGVVTSVFSIVNGTMLRPYGMDDPTSVVLVMEGSHSRPWPYWPYARFVRMRDETTLTRVEASLQRTVRFSETAASENDLSRRVLFVSGGYLQMLGGRPLHGRALEPADDVAGAPPVAVVSHHFWSAHLGADPAIVGQTVWLSRTPVVVVGVLRPDFTGPVEFDARPTMWMPFAAIDNVLMTPPLTETSRTSVEVVARLVPGASRQAAQENLGAIAARTSPPGSKPPTAGGPPPVRLFSGASAIEGPGEADVYTVLSIVLGVSALILALACANTANLLMASAVTRRREMGVRLSLGASTRRLIRQMLNESLLLGLLAGGLGYLLAMWIAPVFGAITTIPPDVDLAPDGGVLTFTTVVALISGVGAGLAPARYGARGNVLVALQSQSGSGGLSAVPSRLRSTFVGFQAAVAMLLLVVAALLTRTALVMVHSDFGFDADRLLVVRLEPTQKGLDHATYLQEAVAALRGLPSVEGVSVAQQEPFGYSTNSDRFTLGGTSFQLNTHRLDGAFFATAGVRLVRGRTFTDDEVASQAPVAVVSERIARAFFPNGDPIGQSLSHVPAEDGGRQDAATIVGVAADAVLDRPQGHVYGAIYRPLQSPKEHRAFTDQGFPMPPSLVVRGAESGVSVRAIEEALRRVNPAVQPATERVLDRLESYLDGKRMLASVAVPVALLALFLAVLGVYGVSAFVASQRTTETSIRMAIGATAADVLRLHIKDALRPVVTGLGLGLLVAIATSRLTASMFSVSGISAYDPIAIGAAVTMLLAGALAAVIIPARRAGRTDLARVLRQA